MKKTTRWSPDTCGCTLEYEWDDAEPEELRTHNFKQTINRCSSHDSLTGQNLYIQVLSENTRKNKVLAIAQQVNSEIKNDGYNWSFDTNRVLKISFLNIPISPAQKAQILNLIEQELGQGLVEVI